MRSATPSGSCCSDTSLLHLVHAALQIGHVLSDIAQIAMHDEVAGKNKGHVARRCLSPPPKQERVEGNGSAQDEQHRELHRAAASGEHPVAEGTGSPFGEHAAQAHFFPSFSSKRLHDSIARNGIGKRRANARILCI